MTTVNFDKLRKKVRRLGKADDSMRGYESDIEGESIGTREDP